MQEVDRNNHWSAENKNRRGNKTLGGGKRGLKRKVGRNFAGHTQKKGITAQLMHGAGMKCKPFPVVKSHGKGTADKGTRNKVREERTDYVKAESRRADRKKSRRERGGGSHREKGGDKNKRKDHESEIPYKTWK